MSRAVLLTLIVIPLGACGVTEPNVVPCGDDCPDISTAGRSGGDGGAAGSGGSAGGRDAAAGRAGTTAAGSGGTSGNGGMDAGGGDGGDGGGAGSEGGAGGDASDAGCGPCSDDLPHCEGTRCVACTQDDHCESGVCEQNACVACRQDTDCTEPTASRCSENQCSPCSQPSHCAHIEGKNVCAAGECVPCTGTSYDACGRAQDGTPQVCDSLTHTCTTHTRRSAGLCDPCVSDEHCGAGQLCVMQYFDEVGDSPDEGELEVGYFCFWREDATEPLSPNGSCANVPPYFGTRSGSESIDGVEATVCGLRVTTCPAYKDYSAKTCSGLGDDASCGDPRFLGDAYCREAAASTYRCTTPCLSNDDCDIGTSCTASLPKYCALQ